MDKKQMQHGYLIAISIMVISLLIASFVSLTLLKPDNNKKKNESNNTNKYEKIDDTKGFYYIQEGNVYKTIPEEENLSFSYPIVNSKDESVLNINNEIKKLYNEQEENVLYAPLNGDTCTCIMIDGIKKCGRTANGYEYNILETDSILNIKIKSISIKSCGSGLSDLEKSYFISKTTGKRLSNIEVLKSFNYDEKSLINAYNLYLEELKSKNPNYFDEYSSISSIDNLTLILIDDNSKIKLGISGLEYGNNELEFDGINLSSFIS